MLVPTGRRAVVSQTRTRRHNRTGLIGHTRDEDVDPLDEALLNLVARREEVRLQKYPEKQPEMKTAITKKMKNSNRSFSGDERREPRPFSAAVAWVLQPPARSRARARRA